MGELVQVEPAPRLPAGVATIRLTRPPMNALNTEMQEELRAAADAVGADDDVRAVVIYGGEKVFAAGADVKEFAGQGHADMVRDAGRLSSSLDALARIPKPVVAAVTGYALGGGCELALTADFRVSADNARWGQPEILLGIIPGAGGTQRLPRLIGPAKAKDLIYTGRFVDAEEALRDRPGRRRRPGRRGLPDGAGAGGASSPGPGVALARGEGRDRRRPRRRPRPPACGWRRTCSPGCSPPRTARSA